jgi:cytidylate kinase
VDSERSIAPLRPAPDAIVIDTDHLDLDQVVDRIVAAVKTTT